MTGIDPDQEYDDVEMQKRIDNAYVKPKSDENKNENLP